MSRLLARLHAAHGPEARRLLRPIQGFVQVEQTAGLPMLVAAVVALVWANSPWGASYGAVWGHVLDLDLGPWTLSATVGDLVRDGLLPVFFFLAGMELKREVVRGELASWRRAALPTAAAVGGMVLPALIYLAFNAGLPTAGGWGVPVATDIAFSLAALRLVGARVPAALPMLLLAVATVDDIGSVAVIAVAYAHQPSWLAVLGAALAVGGVLALGRLGVRLKAPLVVLAVLFCACVVASGIHTTIAGVTLGFLVAARPARRVDELTAAGAVALDALREAEARATDPALAESERAEAADVRDALLGRLEILVQDTEATTDRLSRKVKPWVSYVVLPLFALASAGVAVDLGSLAAAVASPVGQGTFFGLLVGKAVGVVVVGWAAVRAGLATLPPGIGLRHLPPLGLLAGIGFTMSLLIADLAFAEDPAGLEAAKLAILAATVLAGGAGVATLLVLGRRAAGRGDYST